MALCGERTLLGEAGGHGIAASLQCGCWDCDLCGPINQAKLWRLTIELAATMFLTLSSNPHWLDSPDERAHRLCSEWPRFRKWLQYKTRQKLQFLAVVEGTERGEPHVHIALRATGLSAKTLKKLLASWMAKHISAPDVDVQTIPTRSDLERVANYISKRPKLFVGCRRFWTSRGWRTAKWAAEAGFRLLSVVAKRLGSVAMIVVAEGHTIIDQSRLRFRTLDPFPP